MFSFCFQTIVVTKTAKMFPRSNRWQQRWKPKRFTFCSRWESWLKKSVWKHFLLQEGLTDLANKCLFLFIHSMGNSVYSQCTLLLRDVLFYNFEMVQFSLFHQSSSKYDFISIIPFRSRTRQTCCLELRKDTKMYENAFIYFFFVVESRWYDHHWAMKI